MEGPLRVLRPQLWSEQASTRCDNSLRTRDCRPSLIDKILGYLAGKPTELPRDRRACELQARSPVRDGESSHLLHLGRKSGITQSVVTDRYCGWVVGELDRVVHSSPTLTEGENNEESNFLDLDNRRIHAHRWRTSRYCGPG